MRDEQEGKERLPRVVDDFMTAPICDRPRLLKTVRGVSRRDPEKEYEIRLQNGKWKEMFVYHEGVLIEFEAIPPSQMERE